MLTAAVRVAEVRNAARRSRAAPRMATSGSPVPGGGCSRCSIAASARHSAAARLRSTFWSRGGQTNSATGTATANAMPHPASRCGRSARTLGSITARMNVSAAADVPPLTTELSTPENSTAKATRAMASTASQSGLATRVPSAISPTPATPSIR